MPKVVRIAECASLLFAVIVVACCAHGDVKVSASVDKSGDTLVYAYTVENLSGSPNRVDKFAIDLVATIFHGRFPAPRLSPQNWTGGKMLTAPVFSWGSNSDSNDIELSSSLSGFKLLSFDLPIIAFSYTWHYAEPDSGEESIDGVSIFEDGILTRTITPRTPPTPFVALDFIDTLIAMKNEAKTLNWIQESDLSDLIDTRLSKARDHLESEDESEALEDLQAALSAVEEDCLGVGPGVSYLTSEACALLRYNLEYLINQL